MPDIKPGESEKDYVSRCIPYVIKHEGLDSKQAAGKCYGMYKSHKKKVREELVNSIDIVLTEMESAMMALAKKIFIDNNLLSKSDTDKMFKEFEKSLGSFISIELNDNGNLIFSTKGGSFNKEDKVIRAIIAKYLKNWIVTGGSYSNYKTSIPSVWVVKKK